MSERKYHLSYKIDRHEEGITKEEIVALERGGCDAVLLFSIIEPEDGSLSLQLHSMRGKTGEALSSTELFKLWSIMASGLTEDKELSEGRRGVCMMVHEIIKEAVMASRKEEQRQQQEQQEQQEQQQQQS